MSSALDRFLPVADVQERFAITIKAPAAVVIEAATDFDLQSPPLVRAIFRARDILMRAPRGPARKPLGLLAEMRELGWGVLLEEPGRLLICGAACRPWLADPGFTPIPVDLFPTYSEPDRVKIAWTLEAEPLGVDKTRLAQETRVTATDDRARVRFRRYWRWARFGIVSIRLLLLPAIRREAERRYASRG